MDTGNALNQMEKFDFSSPINVTIIFDDSDDDVSFINIPKEQPEKNKNDHDNKVASAQKRQALRLKVNKKNQNTKTESLKNIDRNKNSNSNLNNPIQEETRMEKMTINSENNLNINGNNVERNKNTNEIELQLKQNKSDKKQNSLVEKKTQEKINNTMNDVHVTQNQLYDHDPATTFIEDLLNTLSEHLILIMHSFYHYGVKRNTCDSSAEHDRCRREKTFHFIKFHFFELSYSTVESIILPQEQNMPFIQQFLDNTVLLANNKSLTWKCQRRHVEPFFKELLQWTKQKRPVKTFNSQLSSNENVLLKQRLNTPPRLYNLSHSQSVSNCETPNPTQDKVCIFSSGSPGHEISINISKDALVNLAPESQRQYNHTVQWTGNQNNYQTNAQSALRNIDIVQRPHENSRGDLQKNYNKYYRQPPPYRLPQNSKYVFHNYSIQNNHNIVQPIQNFNNARQSLQNHQNMGPQIHNYGTTPQYPNTNQNSNYLNYLHDKNQMQGRQIGNEITRPVITNVASLNPKTNMEKSGRCCMCSKNIESPPPITVLNLPRELPYCSYLCQELASQIHKISGDYT